MADHNDVEKNPYHLLNAEIQDRRGESYNTLPLAPPPAAEPQPPFLPPPPYPYAPNQQPVPNEFGQPAAFPICRSTPAIDQFAICNRQPIVFPITATRSNAIATSPTGENEKADLKRADSLRKLAKFMLIPSAVMFCMGVALTTLTAKFSYVDVYPTCRPSAGVTVGALGMVTAMAGLRFSCRIQQGNRRPFAVSFFMLSVATAIGNGVTIVLEISCIVKTAQTIRILSTPLAINDPYAHAIMELNYENAKKILTAAMVLEGATVIFALQQLIACKIIHSLLCGIACGANTTKVTVIYIHPETVPVLRNLAAIRPNEADQVYFVATTVASAPTTLVDRAPVSGQVHGNGQADHMKNDN